MIDGLTDLLRREKIRPLMGGRRVMQSGLKKAARPLYGLSIAAKAGEQTSVKRLVNPPRERGGFLAEQMEDDHGVRISRLFRA